MCALGRAQVLRPKTFDREPKPEASRPEAEGGLRPEAGDRGTEAGSRRPEAEGCRPALAHGGLFCSEQDRLARQLEDN